MSFISNLFNPSQGAGYQASGANLLSPSNVNQANTLYNQTQSGLTQQQNFVNALNGQNGINTQNQLSQMLMNEANGNGPNPAQNMLNQSTGQNIASQAALMAGQRGSAANPGLIARLAGQQGAATQQNAVGQAATLGAQQQLNAQNALQGLAGTQVGQQQNALTGLNQATQSAQQNTLNSIAQQNNANVAMQSNINNANAGIAAQNANTQGGTVGGLLGGLGSVATLLAKGGMVQRFADGGPVASSGAPQSFVGKFMSGFNSGMPGNQNPNGQYSQAPRGTPQAFQNGYKIGSNMDGFVSAGLQKLLGNPMPAPDTSGASNLMQGQMTAPSASAGAFGGLGQAAARGGKIMDFRGGGKLPGKAAVKGDSYKNDKVPIIGSPGEIMLPRSVTMAPDAPKRAAQFVAAVQMKQRMRKAK